MSKLTEREKLIARAGFHCGNSGKFSPLKFHPKKSIDLFYSVIAKYVDSGIMKSKKKDKRGGHD